MILKYLYCSFKFCYLVIDFIGSFRGALLLRVFFLIYDGSSRYDEYSSIRDGYGGGRESYLSSRNDSYLSGREYGGR